MAPLHPHRAEPHPGPARAADVDRHDRYRHLRENLVQHRSVTGFRDVKVFCDVCQVFEPDETGLCPVCRTDQPADLVTDLRAQRGGTARLQGGDRGVVA